MITDATFTDSKHRVVCPVSMENANLLSNFALHYTTQKQIKMFGMCRKCRKRMKETGKAILAGKVETPAAIEKHHTLTAEDHTGFTDGLLSQTVDFDFDEIDRALGLVEETPPDARKLAGELIRELMAFCFSHRKLDLRTAAAKFAVIAAGLRPDALDDKTQTELARQLGLTKAAMSKASVTFQDAFGIKFQRSRSVSARAKMRARRLGGPARHCKAAPDGQAEEGGQAEGVLASNLLTPM